MEKIEKITQLTITLEFSENILLKATNDKNIAAIDVPSDEIDALYNRRGGVRDLGLTALLDDQDRTLKGDCYTYVRIGGKWVKWPTICS